MNPRQQLYHDYSFGLISFEDFTEQLDTLNLLERTAA